MAFGGELRRLRDARRLSQYELADLTGVSQRHISCLERGKAQPSRGMALHLGRALGLSPRAQVTLLAAAGYAPPRAEPPAEDPALAQAKRAMGFVLERHEPFPAISLDRNWMIVATNRAAEALAGFLIAGDPTRRMPMVGTGFLEGFFAQEGIVRYLQDRDRIAATTLVRALRDAIETGNEALRVRTGALLSRLDRSGLAETETDSEVLPVAEFVKDGTRLRFLSILVAFAGPCAVPLESLRMEIFYPADDITERTCAAWKTQW